QGFLMHFGVTSRTVCGGGNDVIDVTSFTRHVSQQPIKGNFCIGITGFAGRDLTLGKGKLPCGNRYKSQLGIVEILYFAGRPHSPSVVLGAKTAPILPSCDSLTRTIPINP